MTLSKADVQDAWIDGLADDLANGFFKHTITVRHPDGGNKPTPFDVIVDGRGVEWTFSSHATGSTTMLAETGTELRSGGLDEWLPGWRHSPDLEQIIQEIIAEDLSRTDADSCWRWEMDEALHIASDRVLEGEVMTVTGARPIVHVQKTANGIQIRVEATVEGVVQYS